MKRRLFLQAGAASIAASLMTRSSLARAYCYPPEMYVGGFLVGVQAWCFKEFSFFEAIDKVKETGCCAYEAMSGQRLAPEGSQKFDHLADPSVWAKARMKLERTGVRLVSYYYFNMGKNHEESRKVFDFCKVMDIPMINAEPEKEDMDHLEDLVKEYDIQLVIHNHPKDLIKTPGHDHWNPEFVLDLIENRDPRIGFCADVGHWNRSAINPLDAMKIAEGRILNCHLKDVAAQGPWNEETHNVPLGQGVIDVKAVLDELRRQRFNGPVILEYEHNYLNNVPEIAQCVDYVREYGRKHF